MQRKFLFRILLLIALTALFATLFCVSSFAMPIYIQVVEEDQSVLLPLEPYEVEPTDRVEDVIDKIKDKTGDFASMYILVWVLNEDEQRILEEGNTLQDYSVTKNAALVAIRHPEHIFFNCECQVCHFIRPHKYSSCVDRLCDNDDCIYFRDDAQPHHAFDDCLDADCNNADCPYTREPATEHTYSDCTDSTCNNEYCTVTRVANSAHSYDDCLDAECNTLDCGYTRDASEAHAFDDCLDADCNNADCPYTREPATEHIYSDCTDSTCNNEGCTVTRAANDAHMYSGCTDTACDAPGCSFTREANPNHIFDGCPDTDCNSDGCPYTREAKAHEGGTASCVKGAVCDVCGSEYGETMPHTPNNEEWVITDTHHYHRCEYWSEISSCKEKYDYQEHSYGEWQITKEADVLIKGEQIRECVCGHIDVEEIPAKPMFDKPITQTEWIVLGAAVALVIIVGAVCWYLKKP